MNPLKRIQYNAPVTLTFALICLGVLGLSAVLTPEMYWRIFSVGRMPLTDPLTYWRLFSHVLGHANFAHYISNFMIILLLGPLLEERYSAKRLVLMMAVTALVTGLVFIFIGDGIKMGASGIVFMLILLSSFTNLQRGRVPITVVLVLAIFVGNEVVAALGAGEGNNIAFMSHIVGGLCGAAFGFFANREMRCAD